MAGAAFFQKRLGDWPSLVYNDRFSMNTSSIVEAAEALSAL